MATTYREGGVEERDDDKPPSFKRKPDGTLPEDVSGPPEPAPEPEPDEKDET